MRSRPIPLREVRRRNRYSGHWSSSWPRLCGASSSIGRTNDRLPILTILASGSHLDHDEGDGRLLFEQIAQMDLEGVSLQVGILFTNTSFQNESLPPKNVPGRTYYAAASMTIQRGAPRVRNLNFLAEFLRTLAHPDVLKHCSGANFPTIHTQEVVASSCLSKSEATR